MLPLSQYTTSGSSTSTLFVKFVSFVVLQQSSMVDSPASSLRSSRSSVYESRKSIHLADGAEFEPVPDLTNFRPVTLTVSSFFKQVILKFGILLLSWLDWIFMVGGGGGSVGDR